MLIYHPAYDAYHCLFRMIALIDHVNEIEVDKARILDFYLIFPALVSEIRMPHNYSAIKKEAKKYSNEYRNPINISSTFRDMHEIQMAAIRCLAATGLIEIVSLEKNIIKRTHKSIPDGLLLSMRDFINAKKDIHEFIVTTLSQFHLTGKDGLKDRTNLMEFRYDFS
ncbi:hypothetical protein FY046_12660 [Erwinia sp. 1181_3]|uniref:ABC-three component system middle component 5 n=1 Tax=Erwinia sp. 1181_3 TaxID=2605957 RepID=UPI004059A138